MDCQFIRNIIRNESPEQNIADKICYFVEYYDFAGRRMETDLLPFYPLTPHTVLRMLAEELQNEKVGRNLEFFKSRLQKAVGKDRVCRERYGFLTGLLMTHMASDKEYALQVCREILDKMEPGNYAGSLCRRLEEILFDEKVIAQRKEEIRYLVEALLSEQQLYGYSVKSIRQLPGNLFQGWRQYGHFIHTDYPFLPEPEGTDRSAQIREYMEKLTVRDRIRDLARLFVKKEQTFILVCGLSGIKGDEVDFEIGNVKIYNARFYPKFDFEKTEAEQSEAPEEDGPEAEKIKCPVHAAVTLRDIDRENFIAQARREVERAVDLICCYSEIRVPVYIDMSVYLILDEGLNRYSTGMRAEGEAFRRAVEGLDYNKCDVKIYQELYRKYHDFVLTGEGGLSAAIQNAVRWFRKGQETQRTEDRLLNEWICLESLFPNRIELPQEIMKKPDERKTKFHQIYALVPTMLIRQRFYQYFWACHDYCTNLYFDCRNRENSIFPVSEELARKCDFKYTGRMNLIPFLESLGEITGNIPDSAARDYLEEVRGCLEDEKAVSRLWKRLEEKTEEELLMGYRLRNIIVHNARSSADYVEYYENRLQRISGDVLRRIIYLYEEHPQRTIADILQRENIANREMKEQIQKEGVTDWMRSHG